MPQLKPAPKKGLAGIKPKPGPPSKPIQMPDVQIGGGAQGTDQQRLQQMYNADQFSRVPNVPLPSARVKNSI